MGQWLFSLCFLNGIIIKMAAYKIDFDLIQKALLPKLENKDFIQSVVVVAAQTDELFLSAKSDALPTTTPAVLKELGLPPLDASVLLASLQRLIKALVSLSVEEAKAKAKSFFPSEFNGKLRLAILNSVFQNYEEIRAEFSKEAGTLPRLLDFDWRIDSQIASKYGKPAKPLMMLRLDTEKEAGSETTVLELPRDRVKEILNVFQRIDAQLKAITGK